MVKYSNQSKHIFSLNSGIKKQKIHFWLFRTKTPKTPISLFFSTLSAEKFNNRNLSKFDKKHISFGRNIYPGIIDQY